LHNNAVINEDYGNDDAGDDDANDENVKTQLSI